MILVFGETAESSVEKDMKDLIIRYMYVLDLCGGQTSGLSHGNEAGST